MKKLTLLIVMVLTLINLSNAQKFVTPDDSTNLEIIGDSIFHTIIIVKPATKKAEAVIYDTSFPVKVLYKEGDVTAYIFETAGYKMKNEIYYIPLVDKWYWKSVTIDKFSGEVTLESPPLELKKYK